MERSSELSDNFQPERKQRTDWRWPRLFGRLFQAAGDQPLPPSSLIEGGLVLDLTRLPDMHAHKQPGDPALSDVLESLTGIPGLYEHLG
jgi:hypothetical protein